MDCQRPVKNKETNKWELLSSGTTIPLGEELGAFALNKLVIMMATAKADFYADAEMMGFIEKQIELSAINDTSEVKVALLMPYYLLKNDTMFNDFEDSTEIPNIYYSRSEVALSFHIGVELALDTLRKQGKKITLYTFDTNKDTARIYKIISSCKRISDMNSNR